MHIPSQLLHGRVCPVTALVSSTGIAIAATLVRNKANNPNALRFASVTALVFALQMLNFPINQGTSGHLIGGVLAAALLGTPLAVLSLALVLAVQALVFSDGGITVLGANMLNMALIGAGLGGWLRSHLQKSTSAPLATALACWISVLLAAAACSFELSLSQAGNMSGVWFAMLSTHVWIGLGEAALTLVVLAVLGEASSTAPAAKSPAFTPLALAMAALLLSPFANTQPDGLSWVVNQYYLLHEGAPAFTSLWDGYHLPLIQQSALSTSLAGLVGVLCCFGSAWLLARVTGLRAVPAR